MARVLKTVAGWLFEHSPCSTGVHVAVMVTALALGWLANTAPLELGWGIHFLFGNAFIWVVMRMVGPVCTVVGFSIVSTRTILLWHHPWAWAIWTLEAITVVLARKRAVPVLADLVFWAFLGAPLLFVTYGLVMKMGSPSVELIMAKQAFNGLLNIVIAELAYFGLSRLRPYLPSLNAPAISSKALVTSIFLSMTLLPATGYLTIVSRNQGEDIQRQMSLRLNEELSIATTAFRWHLNEHTDRLTLLGALYETTLADRDVPSPGEIAVIGEDVFVVTPSDPAAGRGGRDGGWLSIEAASGAAAPPTATLTVPVDRKDGHFQLVQHLSLAEIRETVASLTKSANLEDVDFLILNRAGIPLYVDPQNPEARQVADFIIASGVDDLIGQERVLTELRFGTSLMSSLRDTLAVRAERIDDGPGRGWVIVAFASPSGVLLAERMLQRNIFGVMFVFIALSTIVTVLVARDVEFSLARFAAGLDGLLHRSHRLGNTSLMPVHEFEQVQAGIEQLHSLLSSDRRQLEAYENRLRVIEAHAPLILYGLEGTPGDGFRPTYRSPSVKRILGYTVEEASRPEWWDETVHPDDREMARSTFAKTAGKTASGEYRLARADGSYVTLFDTLAIADEVVDGRWQGVGVMVDITDRKLAERQLHQAAKLASLGEMATGMAHELNQPLNVIKMAAINALTRLERSNLTPTDLTGRLRKIIEQTDRAADLIAHMKIFGRLPVGKPQRLGVSEVINRAISLTSHLMTMSSIDCVFRGEERPLFVMAHGTPLEQVVINLMLNARDAINSRDTTEGGRIEIHAAASEHRVRITVQDNGGGIPSDILPQIFEPFFTTKDVSEGTGLGLSISYGIIREMRGTLSAENSAGGARFVIDLPLSERNETSGIEAPTPDTSSLPLAPAGMPRLTRSA